MLKQTGLIMLLLGLALPVWAAQKVALVIGNSAYTQGKPLANPVNDATDVGQKLQQLGFEVITVKNADLRAMRDSLKRFATGLQGAEVGVFFYAGHGIEIERQNYLVPVNADLREAADANYEALRMSDVVRTLQDAKVHTSVVILDACRDNPFAATSRSGSRGLARMPEMAGSDGLMVLYAASPGQVAEDGKGRNGLFTAQLLRQMDQPLLMPQLFEAVKRGVRDGSGGKQQIYSEGDMLANFSFRPGVAGGTLPAERVAPAVDEDLALWADAKGLNTIEGFEDYLGHFPNGKRAGQAKAAIVKLQQEARLAERQAQPQPVQQPLQVAMARPPVNPPVAERYAVGSSFRDCESDCPELVVIPPGSFSMGSNDYNEQPVHTVNINYKLAVGKYEVTFAEWDACVAEGGCNGYRPDDQGWGRGRRPVINVNWNDVQAYVRWLSGKTGQSYRLLSESEWEYVARAGTTKAFSTGDCISTRQANYDGRADYNDCGAKTGEYWQKTVEVGSFAANGFGLYDVHGNVWEWVEDCYQGDGYGGAPVDGSARSSCTGTNAGMRVLRGGAWNVKPFGTRSAIRNGGTPTYRLNINGFRVARRL